jgi:CheY-like chemotaxis protein
METLKFQAEQIKRTKILIVDDLPENLQILGNTLREQGFQIAFATNGKQALTIAASKKPELVLLDMSMPEMDGLTVCRKLKENPITKNIPVIFLTARTESESIRKALSIGAIDYIVKPFNTSELINRITIHLGIDKISQISPTELDKIFLLEIVNILQKEYIPKWNEVKSGMFIDDVVNFAKSLTKLGDDHQIKALIEYGDNLSQAADSLRIEKMSEILEQFPAVIKKIPSART